MGKGVGLERILAFLMMGIPSPISTATMSHRNSKGAAEARSQTDTTLHGRFGQEKELILGKEDKHNEKDLKNYVALPNKKRRPWLGLLAAWSILLRCTSEMLTRSEVADPCQLSGFVS